MTARAALCEHAEPAVRYSRHEYPNCDRDSRCVHRYGWPRARTSQLPRPGPLRAPLTAEPSRGRLHEENRHPRQVRPCATTREEPSSNPRPPVASPFRRCGQSRWEPPVAGCVNGLCQETHTSVDSTAGLSATAAVDPFFRNMSRMKPPRGSEWNGYAWRASLLESTSGKSALGGGGTDLAAGTAGIDEGDGEGVPLPVVVGREAGVTNSLLPVPTCARADARLK